MGKASQGDKTEGTSQPRSRQILVLAGGSGFLGAELAAQATLAGWEVRHLVRRNPQGPREYRWDPEQGLIDLAALKGAQALVNLCGESLTRRPWTPGFKARLRASRLRPTQTLVGALQHLDLPSDFVFLNASAIGFYGDRGSQQLIESAPGGSGFLADLCQKWEAAAQGATASGARVVLLRTGLVLGAGGLLRVLVPAYQWGLGGLFGGGGQWMSLIARADWARAVLWIIDHPEISGPVNLCSPLSLTQEQFHQALNLNIGSSQTRHYPRWLLALGGALAREMLLVSTRVLPQVLEKSGFEFLYPSADEQLNNARGRG